MIEDLPLIFFKSLPRVPGVYKMYSSQGALIYVGKAKNLHRRLLSYRREPSLDPAFRKVRRLRRMLSSIEFEILPSEEAALLRENELLRQKRPLFNRVNTRPRSYPYLLLSKKGEQRWGVELRARRPTLGESDYLFGAFKAKRLAREALESCLRLNRMLNVGSPSLAFLQRGDLCMNELEIDSFVDFLRGHSSRFLEDLFLRVGQRFEGMSPLEQRQCDRDLLNLRDFYERCCSRNAGLLRLMGSSSYWVDQEDLDDWIVKSRFAAKEVSHVV